MTGGIGETGSGYPRPVDDRRLASLARELSLDLEELRDALGSLTPGVAEAVMAGLIRFEAALADLGA